MKIKAFIRCNLQVHKLAREVMYTYHFSFFSQVFTYIITNICNSPNIINMRKFQGCSGGGAHMVLTTLEDTLAGYSETCTTKLIKAWANDGAFSSGL